MREKSCIFLLVAIMLVGGIAARPTAPEPSENESLVSTARTQLGVPYRRGASVEDKGFDCSGFTKWVFDSNGINLPHQSGSQFGLGASVTRDELKPGDLVFFSIRKKRISHVGMYTGGNNFIHATRPGDTVKEHSLDDAYWAKRYVGARRIVVSPPRMVPRPDMADTTLTPPNYSEIAKVLGDTAVIARIVNAAGYESEILDDSGVMNE